MPDLPPHLPAWLHGHVATLDQALRRTVRSGTRIGSGLATAEPQSFYAGLLDHVRAHDVRDLDIRQGLFLAPHPILVGDALDVARPDLPGPLGTASDAIADARAVRRLAAHVEWLQGRGIRFTTAFPGPVLNRMVPDSPVVRALAPVLAGRNRVSAGTVSYRPLHFPHAARALAFDDDLRPTLDLLVTPLTWPDARGRFSFGLANGVSGDVWQWLQPGDGVHVLAHLNRRLPFTVGPGNVLDAEDLRGKADAGELTLVVEDVDPPGLPEGAFDDPDDVESAIATHLVDHLLDDLPRSRGRALQVGIGRISAQAVRLLGTSAWTGRGYTEMLDPLTYDLLEDGTIAGTHLLDADGIRQEHDGLACTFAMGEQGSDFPQRLDGDARVLMVPASRLLQPRAFAGGLGINNVLAIDLAGNVNATARDHHPYSAVGGLATIMRGLAQGGIAYLCMRATHRAPDGRRRSSIMPSLEPGTPVTLTAPDLLGTFGGRVVLVTEQGAVRLDAGPHDALVRALLSVADPEFRDELARAAWARWRIRA